MDERKRDEVFTGCFVPNIPKTHRSSEMYFIVKVLSQPLPLHSTGLCSWMQLSRFIAPLVTFMVPSIATGVFFPRPTAIALASLLPILALSRFSAPVRYYLRLTTFLSGLGLASAWGVIVSVALSLVGQSKNINWVVARSFHGVVAPLVGFRFTVEGEEHLDTRPAVVIGNHQTMLDILCKSPRNNFGQPGRGGTTKNGS